MGSNLALNTAGNWRSIYANTLLKPSSRRSMPYLDLVELPITLESRILAVSATYLEAKPTWKAAGYFYQEVDVPLNDGFTFPGMGGNSTTVDGGKRYCGLNFNTLCIFSRLATEHRYRFEPMPWLQKLNLAIWEYTGPETDTTEELIETLKVDVARLESKIDGLIS